MSPIRQSRGGGGRNRTEPHAATEIVIADLKLAEAAAAIEAAGAAGAEPVPEIERMLDTMHGQTLRNLRLGIGHQSPDYQWWYGHAALDGDLLRIKSALSRNARKRARNAEKR